MSHTEAVKLQFSGRHRKLVLLGIVFIMVILRRFTTSFGFTTDETARTGFPLADTSLPRGDRSGRRPPAKTEDKKDDKKTEELVDKISKTEHTATINGKEIKYTATAGTMVMKDDEGKPKATIFFIAYTKNGVDDLAQRPITFAFNGGPGSSSVWLHLGMLGPKRVKLPDDASPLAAAVRARRQSATRCSTSPTSCSSTP